MSSGDLSFKRIFSSRYSVEKCAFSPNGRLLATCFGDYSVRVFAIQEDDHAPSNISIQLLGIIRDHKSNVWCVAFSADSTLLCTCSSDKTARIWDVQTLECRYIFSAHTDTVWCCGFAPAEAQRGIVGTGSSDLTVKLWKWPSGEVVCDLTGFEDAIDCIDFTMTQSRTLLCTACRDCTIKVWDITTQVSSSQQTNPECLLVYQSMRGVTGFCKFIHQEQMFSNDNHMLPLPKDRSREDCDKDLQSCPDLLVVGGENNNIIAWDVNSLQKMLDEQSNQRTLTAIDPNTTDETPDEMLQLPSESSCIDSNEKITVQAAEAGTDVDGCDLNNSPRDVDPEIHSPQDNVVMDHGQSESAILPILVLRGHTNIVWDCCSMHTATENGGLLLNSIGGKKTAHVLISCSGDRTIRLWDLADGGCVSVCTMPEEDKESQILTCSFCSSQNLLAIGLYNGTLLLGFI